MNVNKLNLMMKKIFIKSNKISNFKIKFFVGIYIGKIILFTILVKEKIKKILFKKNRFI
jgi:hypothetical protein